MHFVIISVNRDSADLFIGDKSALAQMSSVHRYTHIHAHTVALALICNASNMWSTVGGKATHRNLHASFHSVCP